MPARPPVKGTAKFVHAGRAVKINKQVYFITDLRPDKRVADPAYRLTKEDGTEYDVHQDRHGAHCDCKDFIYAREHSQKKCKHVEALKALGLLRK